MQSTPSYALFLVAGLALLAPVHAQVCGNGIREGNEQCDDGNRASFDGCSARCTFEQTQRINHLALQGTTSHGVHDQCARRRLHGLGPVATAVGDRRQCRRWHDVVAVVFHCVERSFRHVGSRTSKPACSTRCRCRRMETTTAANDVDWWYAVDDTEMDAMQNSGRAKLSGSIATNALTAQASSFELMTSLGSPVTMSTSALNSASRPEPVPCR